jgi:ATP-dependent Clp protease ATP-binding subunit ClpB
MEVLRRSFRPEFLNRLDEIVFYKPLTRQDIRSILDLLVADLSRRLADKQLTLELTDEAKDFVIQHGYDSVYGARPLRRFLQARVETLIARLLIAEHVRPHTHLMVGIEQGKLRVVQQLEP